MKKLFKMKKSKKGKKLIKISAFLLPAVILTFFAAGGSEYLNSIQNTRNNATVSFDANEGNDISSAMVNNGMAMEEDTDEVYVPTDMYLDDCDASSPIVIHSEDEITEANLSEYLTVDSYLGEIPEGFTVTSLGNGDYEVIPSQKYQEGCTYDFTVLNGASIVTEDGENITELSQRIHKDESEVLELKNDIVYLDWDDVIRNGSDYKLYIPKSDEYNLTENTPLCMIDGYNEWVADGSNEDTFAPLFEENSLFITVESVSCDFMGQTISGRAVSGDNWYYIEARDGDLADIISDVDVYEEFDVPAEELIDIEEIEQQVAESDGIRQMEDLLTCAILDDENFLEIAEDSSDEQYNSMFFNPMTVSAEEKSYRMFREGLAMNEKQGVKIPVRSDIKVGVYWSSGHATNPNFPGIDRNDPDNKKWSAMQITVTFEKEIKGVKIKADIDITEYMKVTMQGYKDWDGLKLDFDYAANMYTQTNFDFSVKIWSGDGEWEDISDSINNSLASDEIVAKYQKMIGAKEDGYIEIVDTPLIKNKYLIAMPIPIFSVNLNLNYVLKFNLAAGITSDFTYLDATQVGMKGKTYGDDKGIKSYEHELIGANRYSYDLNVCGYLGVKTGLKGELTLSFNGLEKFGEVGVSIELGVYADFYGYMNLHIAKPQQFYNNVEKSFSGGYFVEVGIYLELKLIARSQAFNAEAGLTLLDMKFPLFSLGQQYVPCNLTGSNDEYLLTQNSGNIFDICGISAECMDMKTGDVVTKKPSEIGAFYVKTSNPIFQIDPGSMNLVVDSENTNQKSGIATIEVYSKIPTMNNAGKKYTDYFFCTSTKLYWADPSLKITSLEEFQNKTYKASYCLKLPDNTVIEVDSKEVRAVETVGYFDWNKAYLTPYNSVYQMEDKIYTTDKTFKNLNDISGEYLTKDTVFYRNVTEKNQFYVYFVYYDSNEKCWKGDVGQYKAGETPVPPAEAQNTPEMIGWGGYDNARREGLSEITALSENPYDCLYVLRETGKESGGSVKVFTGTNKAWAIRNTENCFDVYYDNGSSKIQNPDLIFAQKYVAQYKDCNITFNYEGEEEMLSTSATVSFGERPTAPDAERFVDRVGKLVGWDVDGDCEVDAKYNIYGKLNLPEVHEDGMIINAIYDQPQVTINVMNYSTDTGQYEIYRSFRAKSKQVFTFNGEEVLLDGEKVILEGDETDIFQQVLDSLPPEFTFNYWKIAKISPSLWENPQEYTLQKLGYIYYICPHTKVEPTYTFLPVKGTQFTINPDSENPEKVDRFTKKVTGIFVGSYSWRQDFDYWVLTGDEDNLTTFAGWDADGDGKADYKIGESIDIMTDHTFQAVLETTPITLTVNIKSPVKLDFPESVKSHITSKEKDSEYTYVFEGVRSEYNVMMDYINGLSANIITDEETGYEYYYYAREFYLKDQTYFENGEAKTFSYNHDITIVKVTKGYTVKFNAGEGGYFRNNDNTQVPSFSTEVLNGTYNINDFTIYASTSPRHDGGFDTCYVVDYWTDENGNVVPDNEFTVSKGDREFTAHWKYQVAVKLSDPELVGDFEVGADYQNGIGMWITEGEHTYDELIKPVQTQFPTSLYKVTGWKDSRDSEDVIHKLDEKLVIDPYDANVTFTAVWEVTGAQLYFNHSGFVEGTGENLAPGHNFNADNKVLLPFGTYKVSDFPVVAETESDEFTNHTIGWKDESGKIYSLDDPEAKIVLDKNTDLTQTKLTPVTVFSECAVTFSGNGGRFSDGSSTFTKKLEVKKYDVSEFPVPVRENTEFEKYTFTGWDVRTNEGSDTLEPGDTFDMQQTCYNITALWECTELKHHYEYSFDENQHWLVCINEGCTGSAAEPDKTDHSCDENGFCAECGYGYETPPINNGTYEISTAAQLYGFAKLVNDNTDPDVKFNAVLMNDIKVNENVIDDAGNLVGDKLKSWTPIGKRDMPYSGVFDGNGYSISGLYYADSNGFYAGLFAVISNAEIRNLKVDNSYFAVSPYGGWAGCIAAKAKDSVISAVESNATLSGMNVGGLCAEAIGTKIENCLFRGKIIGELRASGISSGESNIVNCLNNGRMIVGEECEAFSIGNSSTIVNCYYNADLCGIKPSEVSAGREIYGIKDEQMHSGEIAYLLSQGCTVGETNYDGSVWGQDLSTENCPVPNGKKVLANSDESVFANDIIIYGQSTTLDGMIGMNIYVAADDNYTGWKANFNGTEVTTPEKDENGLYKFTYEVAAKDMEQEITFTLSSGDSVNVSVKTYLEKLQNSESADTNLVAIAEVMEAYGNAADAFFNGESVGESVTEINYVKDSDLSNYAFEKDSAPEGISYYGSSLLLKSETTVRHYFKLADGHNIAEFTFTVDGEAVTPVEKQGYYYIDITNISADKLDTPHTVKIGDTEVISGYSAMSYAKTVLSSETADDNLKNLVKMLYLYSQNANAFSETQGGN